MGVLSVGIRTMQRSDVFLGYIVLLFVAYKVAAHMDKNFAGPYDLKITEVGQCDDSGTKQIYCHSTRLNKLSRDSVVFNSNMSLEIPLDDKLDMHVTLAVWGNGGWRPNMFEIDFERACISGKAKFPTLYNMLISMFNEEDCPVPVGNRYMPNVSMKIPDLSRELPSFPFGNYRIDFQLLLHDVLVGCLRFVFDLVPKPNPHKKKKN